MTFLVILLTAIWSIPPEFTPVQGFNDLDETAAPARFGLLLVAGEDTLANTAMAEMVAAAACSLPDGAEVDLFVIDPDGSGYGRILALCTDDDSLPAVLVIVGHCGYLQLDTQYLASEVLDSWYTWGSADSRRTGICNFCRRCNP